MITLIKSVLAGIFISIGCVAYLSTQSVIAGALFFCIGLFAILNFKLNLFTGMVCYCTDEKNYLKCLLTLIGNFIGTLLVALPLKLTHLNIMEKATDICLVKLTSNPLSLFILAILCNILIYLAVEGYKNFKGINKILALFFGVTVFIICGFEHCIADMFYFNFLSIYSFDTFLRLFVIILGNCIGGLGIHTLIKWSKRDEI